jgi:type II secretory pathway component GspD/PulD (secretin)
MNRFTLHEFSLPLLAVLLLSLASVFAAAQQPAPPSQGIAVQLPTVTNFGISTVVMLPDAGATRLGSISRGASALTSAGAPFLSNVPGVSPLFRSQGLGSTYSTGLASVQAHVIISSEMEAGVLAEAERRLAARRSIDPNGSPPVQRRAAFISRNIGRK